jgi:putative ABC transport system ATP-binding protein
LDTKTGLDIIRILARLNKKRGVTEIIVTHDPSITKFTHRTIFIRDGLIQGEKVNENPEDPAEVKL